jgi:uncharacterized protein (DUF4213/DUF364 family)
MADSKAKALTIVTFSTSDADRILPRVDPNIQHAVWLVNGRVSTVITEASSCIARGQSLNKQLTI